MRVGKIRFFLHLQQLSGFLYQKILHQTCTGLTFRELHLHTPRQRKRYQACLPAYRRIFHPSD